jgi:CheY-like chemotaxis protein
VSLLPSDVSLRVLLVEHDAHTRHLHATALNAAGFNAIGIADAEHALEQAAAIRPAVIVADLALGGGLDGLELCERLKAHDDTRPIAVLVLTGGAHADVQRRAERAGCVSVEMQPLIPDDLVAIVLRTLHADKAANRSSRVHADPQPADTFSIVAHRRHAGGWLVTVRYWNELKNEKFSIAFSGAATPEPHGPAFFGTVQMAKEAADDALRMQGHVCDERTCAEWRDGLPLPTTAREPQDRPAGSLGRS